MLFTDAYKKILGRTVLIAIFVLLSACQSTQEEPIVVVPPPNNNEKMMSELKQIGVDVHEDDRGVIITLLIVYFDFDSSNLRSDARVKIARMANILDLPKAQTRKISIEGHTDSVGDPQYNIKLSAKRAEMVLKELAFSDVDEQRMSANSKGEVAPIADNSSLEGRERNRRVEIIIHNPA